MLPSKLFKNKVAPQCGGFFGKLSHFM
ncbi:uncharacterized protein METZ01_LOCUS228722 [marine metagenome]|uniref:Uncharacterized protein n=1 Tax=marine metagenome TaxID=408172 RepID=A0A382GL43_9ZZZZ